MASSSDTLCVRYLMDATEARKRGCFARALVIHNVTSEAWTTEALNKSHTLGVGDLALLSEIAPRQWQRDAAVHNLRSRLHR